MARTVPAPRTWVNPAFVSDTDLNTELRDALKYMIDPPRAELRQTATQNFTSGTFADVTFTIEDYDQFDDPAHDTAVNTARYTAPASGWYEVSGVVAFAVNATGNRFTRYAINGAAVNNSQICGPGVATNSLCLPAVLMRVFLTVGDYVTLQGAQNAGVLLASAVAADIGSRFSVRWVGK